MSGRVLRQRSVAALHPGCIVHEQSSIASSRSSGYNSRVMRSPRKKGRRTAAWCLTTLFLWLVLLGIGHHHAVPNTFASILAARASATINVPGSGGDLRAAPTPNSPPYDCPVCHWLAQPLLAPETGPTTELSLLWEALAVALPPGDVPAFVRVVAHPGCRAPPLTPSS
jgi:hypothetical protein